MQLSLFKEYEPLHSTPLSCQHGTRTQLGMYDPERRSTIQYELVRLPLQDHVASVRKAVWSVWRDTKVG